MPKVNILFEDDYLMVIDKPSGMVVDNSSTNESRLLDIASDNKSETLEDWLIARGNKVKRGGIVHRLDKETSGVLLVAKTDEVLEDLQAQFKDRKTKKEYLALVHGLVEAPGVVEGDIGRNPGNREKFIVLDEGGKEASTEYEPIQSYKFTEDKLKEIFSDYNKIQMRKLQNMGYGQFTLLRCFPKTGRTHQIRVHLKHIQKPIVSDEKYVGRKMYRLDKRFCPRLFLHARKLGFYHPKDGWMEVESELPEDLKWTISLFS